MEIRLASPKMPCEFENILSMFHTLQVKIRIDVEGYVVGVCRRGKGLMNFARKKGNGLPNDL